MVGVLDRKLAREVLHMGGQLVAIVLVVACGVAVYVTFATNLAILRGTRDSYYARQQFADVFASVSRAPSSTRLELEAISGVAQVETRTVERSTVYLDQFDEPVVSQFVSLPDQTPQRLNLVYLRSGRMPQASRQREAIVIESFASAHRIEIGDEVDALINGRRSALSIVGVGLSPEYVFPVNPQGGLPDAKRLGVFWLSEPTLAAAYSTSGSFNEVALKLAPGANEADVIVAVDGILQRYGGRGAFGRDLHGSNRQMELEFRQLSSQGVVVPLIFLGVAAFLLNVVMTRLIATQREQIAVLKALGYSNLAVGFHYTKLVSGVVGLGVVLGIGLGVWMGQGVSTLYRQFFSFPSLEFHVATRVMVQAAAMTAVAAALGTYRAVRSVAILPPAEAMRPPAPASQRVSLLERAGLGRLLGPGGRMALRSLTSRPGRSVLTVLGVGFSISILMVGNFSGDAMDYLMNVQFRLAMRDEMNVGFAAPLPHRALRELEQIDGVRYAEGLRLAPVRVRNGSYAHELTLTGVQANADLRRSVDKDLHVVEIPRSGVLLTDYLAELLHVSAGDFVELELLEGDRRKVVVVVAGTIHESFGVSATMDLRAVNRLLGEGPVVNAASMEIEPGKVGAVFEALKAKPRVVVVSRTDAMFAAFEEMSGAMLATMRAIFVFFASVISIGIVYNSARISFSERARELASMRVMGFTRAEVSSVLLMELAVLMLLAVPIGWALGYGFVYLVIEQARSELYRFPLILQPHSYASSAIVVLAAGLAAALLVRRRIDDLDMVAVLKTKD